MALVPLQDVPEAVRELRRAVTELGAVDTVLPANSADVGVRKALGHPDFWPIYEEAERLDVPVATHGGPSLNLGLNSFNYLAMTVALEHPIAQMIQITSFVFEGVFDRFKTLRVGFLEAGTGWVPYMIDRLDRFFCMNRNGHREYSAHAKSSPSVIFASGRLYFSCEGGEPSLRNLVDRMGHKTLLFASDFPHETNIERARPRCAICSSATISAMRRSKRSFATTRWRSTENRGFRDPAPRRIERYAANFPASARSTAAPSPW